MPNEKKMKGIWLRDPEIIKQYNAIKKEIRDNAEKEKGGYVQISDQAVIVKLMNHWVNPT